jgi:hypothetical protein
MKRLGFLNKPDHNSPYVPTKNKVRELEEYTYVAKVHLPVVCPLHFHISNITDASSVPMILLRSPDPTSAPSSEFGDERLPVKTEP